MSDTMRPMFTNEGFAVRACRGHFHVTVGGCDLALPGDPFQTREAALDVALSEATTQLAALTAENERLKSAVTEWAGMSGAVEIAISDLTNQSPWTALEVLRKARTFGDRARAALPSSRETTDGQ